ncbi:M56 family metallopeptidase [Shewanella psychropiezotolerans]|uniref:Protein TonB n=1 Tax=Shewanella psychropiezotolerans TaxID=2593655 RepID=A0ABX5X2R4_9GAMM|nr:M56 family metallopeptidase [Shewanella psychropiezotolerans]QDO85471.1 M56 family metallopeptidase [Shewanella psychropiezotolerans]
MINWLTQQSILISLVCAFILLFHKPLLKQLGAHHMYSLWLAIPLMLLGSVVLQFLPNLLAESKLASFEHYRVLASLAVKKSESLIPAPLVAGLWLSGIAVMTALLLLQRRYLNKLLSKSTPYAHPQSGELNINALMLTDALPILQSPEITSPMLTGVIKPTIIVPSDFHKLTVKQQKAVLEHELFHHERGDIIINLLAYGLLAIFWFNPLCWLAYRRFRDDQELACDAQITSLMNTDEKIAYSHALLAYSQHAQMGMLHTHYGNKNILKERIMQMKKQHGKSTLTIIAMTLGLGLASLILNQQVQAGDHQTSSKESTKLAKSQAHSIHPLTRVEPKYPKEAAEANQNGYVQLKFDISKSGMVSNVKVIKSSPKGVFDKSAVKALKQWVYKKSKKGAKGSKVQLDFVIDEPAANVERIKVTAN